MTVREMIMKAIERRDNEIATLVDNYRKNGGDRELVEMKINNLRARKSELLILLTNLKLDNIDID